MELLRHRTWYFVLYTFIVTILPLQLNAQFGSISEFCSDQNTNPSYEAYYNLYMSTGNCTNNCDGQYAFGVLQGFYCWCSNIQPADVLDTSQCSDKCPGYGKETCGNVQSKLFNYFSLGPTPTATEGPITSSTSSSDQGTTTSSASQSVITTFITNPNAPSGAPKTIISTVNATPTSAAANNGSKSHGTSTGTIVGAVIGSLIAIALLGLLGFVLYRNKRARAVEENEAATSGVGRNASILSRAGLSNNGRPEKTNNGPAELGSSRFSGPTNGPNPPPMAYTGTVPIIARQNSRPMIYDQRLNPNALMNHNGSRVSVNTIDDRQDYSRPLNVTNPDL